MILLESRCGREIRVVAWVVHFTVFVRPTWIHCKLSGAGFFRSPNVLMFIWRRMRHTFRWVVMWRIHTTLFKSMNPIADIFIVHSTLLPCYKCYHWARDELGFLIKGVHKFLADIFKSYTQPNSQLFSRSSLKRPKRQSATWRTYKTLSERSSSVIRACHCRLCWSRSKSWRYCHTRLTGYVLLFWEISCPL